MKLLLAAALVTITASANAANIWCKLSKTDAAGLHIEATKSVEINNAFTQAIVTLEDVTLTGSAAQLPDGRSFLWGIRSKYSSGQGMDLASIEGPIFEQYVGLSNGIAGVCRVTN